MAKEQNQNQPADENKIDKILGAIGELGKQVQSVNDRVTNQSKTTDSNLKSIAQQVELLTSRVSDVEDIQKNGPAPLPPSSNGNGIHLETNQEPPDIEFLFELVDDKGRMRDFKSLKRIRFRSRYDVASIQARDGKIRSLGERAQQTPTIPGLHFHFKWNADTAPTLKITDPLGFDENEELRKALSEALINQPAAQPPNFVGKIGGIPDEEMQLNIHQAKSFVWDCAHYAEQGHAELIRGTIPTKAQCDQLPGRRLFDPHSESQIQPAFKDLMEAYYEKVNEVSS